MRFASLPFSIEPQFHVKSFAGFIVAIFSISFALTFFMFVRYVYSISEGMLRVLVIALSVPSERLIPSSSIALASGGFRPKYAFERGQTTIGRLREDAFSSSSLVALFMWTKKSGLKSRAFFSSPAFVSHTWSPSALPRRMFIFSALMLRAP